MRIAAALALALLLAPAAAADFPHRVYVYGDSFAVGTKPYLPDELPGWRVKQNVDYARLADSAIPALRNRGKRLEPVIHISLGTFGDSPARRPFRRAVRRTMRAAGSSRCVVWANIYRPAQAGDDHEPDNAWWPLNEVLAHEAARRDNLVVVDWASMIERHPGWRLGDGTHVSERAYRARAHAVARGARDCYGRLAP